MAIGSNFKIGVKKWASAFYRVLELGSCLGYDVGMRRMIFATALLFVFALMPDAQTQLKPEDGLVSPTRYTSAFLGFSLPLPQDAQLQLAGSNGSPNDPFRHVLFAAYSVAKGYPVMTVIADEISESHNPSPKKAVLALGAKGVDTVPIGGKEFFRGRWREDNIERVTYATATSGYVLYVVVFSYDKKVLEEFERSIRALTFFDPKEAKEQAGPDSRPYQGPPSSR